MKTLLSLPLAETEKKVIIKILPLPIPVGTPIPAPVHIGVPATPPFVGSQYGAYGGQYGALPLLNGLGLAPRMDKGEAEQVGTRRSADPDHSNFGGLGGHSDSHTLTSHHHTHSSQLQQQPQSK